MALITSLVINVTLLALLLLHLPVQATTLPPPSTLLSVLGADAPLSFDTDPTNFNILTQLLHLTNATTLLTFAAPHTVLVPDDGAIINTLSHLGVPPTSEGDAYNLVVLLAARAFADPLPTLTSLLTYHVLPTSLNATQILTATEQLPTLLPHNFLHIKDGQLFDSEPYLPPANIDTTRRDIPVAEGVLHILDRVLFPQSIVPSGDVQPAVEGAFDPEMSPEGSWEPSPEPSSIPEGFDSPTNSPTCFPADALITMADGRYVRMAELAAGDNVAVGDNVASRVYLFSHRSSARGVYVTIHGRDGRVLTISPGHLLYLANGLRAPARQVRKGDVLRAVESNVVVKHVTTGFRNGLFAPVTLHGDIVVDGFVVSSYTDSLPPSIAHIVLWPVRMMVHLGWQEPLGNLMYTKGWPGMRATLRWMIK